MYFSALHQNVTIRWQIRHSVQWTYFFNSLNISIFISRPWGHLPTFRKRSQFTHTVLPRPEESIRTVDSQRWYNGVLWQWSGSQVLPVGAESCCGFVSTWRQWTVLKPSLGSWSFTTLFCNGCTLIELIIYQPDRGKVALACPLII